MTGNQFERGRSFDVTIVGAGLAGLQCARLLALDGIRVLLVDRKADVRDGVRTTGIFVRRTFEELPLPPDSLGPVVRRVVLHSPSGRTQTLESDVPEFRVGRMQKIYLDMLGEATDRGVTWLPSTSFYGIDRDPDGGMVVWLRREHGLERVSTRFIVGADGVRSKVAAALDLSRNSEVIVGVEEVWHGVEGTRVPALHCFIDPRIAPGYIGWLADDGHEVHAGVAGYRNRFEPRAALRDLRERVASICDLESGRLAERRGGPIPVGGILPRISCDRGLLLGDAAGAVSPLTAGGLDGAMRLSRFAAEVLSAAIRCDDPRLLQIYTSRDIGTRFISRRWMRRALSSVRSPLVVEAGCALLRTPPLSGLVRHVFFGRGSFPEPDRTALPGRPIAVSRPVGG